MKKIVLICAIFSFGISAKSQTYTLTPGNVDTVEAPLNTLSIFDIYQNNITSSKILLSWNRISISLPVGWDYSLCDLGACYTGIPPGGTMDSVDVGQMGFLGLNINPFAIAGQGIVKLYVYDEAFPTNGDTLTWVVNASPVSVSETNNEWNIISVYPNPSTNYFTINNIPETCMLFIFDAVGKLIEQSQITSNQKTIDVSNYTNGVYTLTLVGANKIVNRNKIIVQK